MKKPVKGIPLGSVPICGSNEHIRAMENSMLGPEDEAGGAEIKDVILMSSSGGACPYCFRERMDEIKKKYGNSTYAEFIKAEYPEHAEKLL